MSSSKVTPKILQASCLWGRTESDTTKATKQEQQRLQQYMNQELPDAQTGFRKGTGTRDQIANIC